MKMNVKMNIKGIIFLAFLMGMLIAPNSQRVVATQHFLPITDVPPIIDGNITTQEWNASVQLNATIGGGRADVLLTTTNDSLFFALNFTNPEFVIVNASNPINQTHDFVALQIDRNLDKKEVGTIDSPDDILVVDQYNETAYDGSTTANATAPLQADVAVNGTNEGNAVRLNQTENGQTIVSYEFTKPANSQDVNGSDYNLKETNILQFRFVVWFNSSANATFSDALTTEWFTLRVNETGTGFALAPRPEETRIYVDALGEGADEGLRSVLELYGYNFTFNKDDSVFNTTEIEDDALVIVLVGKDGYSTTYIKQLTDFVRLGGQAIVLLSNLSNSAITASKSIASNFGMQFLENRVLQNNGDVVTIESSKFNSRLIFTSGNSTAIDREAEAVEFTTGVLNITEALNKELIQSQKFAIYNLFEGMDDIVYDQNGNLVADPTETYNENLSLGVAMDFQLGGRLALFPTNFLQDDYLTAADNIEYLLRMVPWTSKHIGRIQVNNFTISINNATYDDVVKVTANVTDNFGEIIEDASVDVIIKRAGEPQKRLTLFHSGNGLFTGEFTPDTYGWQELEIDVFFYGYGFASASNVPIFVQKPDPEFNSLSDLNLFLAITGIASIAIFVITYTRIKKF